MTTAAGHITGAPAVASGPAPDVGRGTMILAAAFALYSVLLYLPLTVYVSNADEFSLRLGEAALLLVLAWGVSVACAAGALLLLPARARMRAAAIALSLGLLTWVQGSLLVWQYGAMDGRDIEWGRYWPNGLVDTPIWLIVLAAAILAPARFVKVARPVAAIVIIVQSALLLTSIGFAAPSRDRSAAAIEYAIDDAPKYSFSPERNVIVVVLDTFQSDVFAEIIATKPRYADRFEGFTYFPNALAGSNYTQLAVPALLTGRLYDNSRPREEFMREAFVRDGITAELRRAGFAVDLYPWAEHAGIPLDTAVASNLTKRDTEDDERRFSEKKLREALRLIDLAIFRSAPHFLKQYVFFSHERGPASLAVRLLVPDRVKGLAAIDAQYELATFVENAPADLPLDRGAPAFKLYHFKGPHVPLTVDESLRFTGRPVDFNRRNYRLQAEANLLWLGRFLESLEKAGIYDRTLIFVVGDHGNGDTEEMYLGAEGAPDRLDGTDRGFPEDKARGVPLVLVKRIGASGPLEVSDAPVSALDLPSTVLAELGLERRDSSPSMFDWAPDARRVRHYAAFDVGPSSNEFVDDITLYRVEGHSWRNESWAVETILSPPGS